MTYSKIHQRFSERLNQPDALTNPEKYLGPNWEDVLNFWIYLDTLSDQEKEKMKDRYYALDSNVRLSARFAAGDVAYVVVGWKFRNESWCAAYDVVGGWIFGYATEELIGSHKILEQGNPLTFLSLCIKS